jgi:hypothetical protein
MEGLVYGGGREVLGRAESGTVICQEAYHAHGSLVRAAGSASTRDTARPGGSALGSYAARAQGRRTTSMRISVMSWIAKRTPSRP